MSMCSILSYILSMILAVGFVARPRSDCAKLESASLTSWKANAPPVPVPNKRRPTFDNRRPTFENQSSINGYAWSRSARSTIPSIPEHENENMEQAPQNAPMMRATGRQHHPPPTNNVPRRYDDASTLTWDPGY
jgi:hypothetical protein